MVDEKKGSRHEILKKEKAEISEQNEHIKKTGKDGKEEEIGDYLDLGMEEEPLSDSLGADI